MTDVNDPTPVPTHSSGAGTAVAAAAGPRRGDADHDPLATLHKMSTTAGISSQEYVAINIPSIIAMVLGLASVMAVPVPVLLVIPLAAIVTGLVSLSQIRASNGTQTGRGFAWLGIVLALAIGGFVFVRAITDRYQTQADRQAIAAKIEELGRLVKARDYDTAYARFSSRFHNRINRDAFGAKWDLAQGFSNLGHINSMEWNRTNILFQQDVDSGAKVASAAALVRFEKEEEPARYTLEFRKSGQKWEIDDAPSVFPVEKPARRR
jgi:hypothetical protein